MKNNKLNNPRIKVSNSNVNIIKQKINLKPNSRNNSEKKVLINNNREQKLENLILTSPNNSCDHNPNNIFKNPTSPNIKLLHSPNNNIPFIGINPSELALNVHDDYKTVSMKNTKLRNLLVVASNKINQLQMKMNEKEDDYKIEKAGILDELDKITSNYKIYAEAYKNYSILEERLNNLQKDYNHNYKVLTSYQESLSKFLKDYMEFYKSIASYLDTKYNTNPIQFLIDIKEKIIENLSKYKGTIDNLNFRETFEEYTQIINLKNNGQRSSKPKIKYNESNELSLSPIVPMNEISQGYNISKNNTKENKENDPYNYPFQPQKIRPYQINSQINPQQKSTSPARSRQINKSNVKSTQKNQRQVSVDNIVDTKTKCIENMENHIKNYFDQNNTKKELKDLTNSENAHEKINNNLTVSKDSLNTSNISNIFEKNSNRDAPNPKIQNRKNIYQSNELHELTPQFDEKNHLYGYVNEDFEKNKEGEISCKVGDRVDIISINRTHGYLFVNNNGEKGFIPESYVDWDDY